MNEKKYEKRLNFQSQLITRQSKQIDDLKKKNEKLENECRKKDEIISSVDSLRDELIKEIDNIKKQKEQYKVLIDNLKTMKNIMNQEVFKKHKRYWLIKFLLR